MHARLTEQTIHAERLTDAKEKVGVQQGEKSQLRLLKFRDRKVNNLL